MSEVILYGDPRSTYMRTARLVCAEKGVNYAIERVGLDALHEPDGAYGQIHPFRKMPALRHGDVVLYETGAIARYIDEAFDGPPLQPADAGGRARMEQWISVVRDYVYDAMIRRFVLQFVFPKGPDGRPDNTVIGAALTDIEHQLTVFDAALGDKPFLLGEQPTLADLFLAPILYYVVRMPKGRGLVGACPNVARSIEAMAARPSMAATEPPSPG